MHNVSIDNPDDRMYIGECEECGGSFLSPDADEIYCDFCKLKKQKLDQLNREQRNG